MIAKMEAKKRQGYRRSMPVRIDCSTCEWLVTARPDCYRCSKAPFAVQLRGVCNEWRVKEQATSA